MAAEPGAASGCDRLLVYAMQSSGASTFCHFLAQRPGSIGIIDVWSRDVTPRIDAPHPVVAKATVTMTRTSADHIASFRPQRTILFVRDPVAVYASLRNYPYAHRFGTIEEKIRRFEREYVDGQWDAVIRYEDFVARVPLVVEQAQSLGWDCDPAYWEMPRTLAMIQEFNGASSSWCRDHFRNGWAFGNSKPGPVSRTFARRPHEPELISRVAALTPVLFRAYAGSNVGEAS